MERDEENVLFNYASEIIRHTTRNLFLTGKAGTGKTTFLKFIKEHAFKNTVVIAPTGVAAINAGGVTMHSFFQLPFIPYVPQETNLFGNMTTVDRHGLIKGIRFNREKIKLINELELLIIDEVSMLRADMLDAIDAILRHFRRMPLLPFGGVQVLLIGDLFQLPPVVSDTEWPLMKVHYPSPFFFSSKVIEQHPPLFIELKKIYRQNEESFINLLNNIRNNSMEEADYELLHQRYRPDATDVFDDSITLTTHNRMADQINLRELHKLEGHLRRFAGEIKGDFSEKSLPTEMHLDLKEGAQVMFIKNDPDPAKRYFNGKLAIVKSMTDEAITVILSDSNEELRLEKEIWRNIRYSFNKETNRIDEEELGSFTQYPVRLAWAITIHKSQGLTFDRAVIDAGASFAAGQVYVALSRCRTLEGLVLLSRISPHSVQNDERILAFTSRELKDDELRKLLVEEKPKYASTLLLRTFDWRKLLTELELFKELTEEKKLPEKEMIQSVLHSLIEKALAQQEVASKFNRQLEQLLGADPIDSALLNDRVTKAKQFFAKALHDELITPIHSLQFFLKGKTKVKQYSGLLNELEDFIWKKLNDVQRSAFGGLTFDVPEIERKQNSAAGKSAGQKKGDSKIETLEFYRQGKHIEEIAKQRGFAISTIEGHLAHFITTGDVNVLDFLTNEELDRIRKAATEAGYEKYSPIKQLVGEDISYGKIKMALNYLKKEQME